jgi:RNA polymerase sigma-70 factor (ECF subfamily)
VTLSHPDAPRVLDDMNRETELTLVAGLRDGDTAAFDAVHDAFHARLFTFLLRLCRRRDVAEDLLEETWLRLVKHAHRLEPDTRLAAWLFTVARRVHVTYVRSRVLEDSAAAGLIALWPCGIGRASPFEEAAASELQRRIERALASMPLASREALLLVAIAGLDQNDAAAVCGVTPEAFRQRLSRARASLARAIAETPAGARVLREVLS